MSTMVEQRMDARTDLAWPVSLWLPEANSFFNGRSANISKSGAMVTMPVTTPVEEGHIVEINFPRTSALALQKGSYARIKAGKVVRVDRKPAADSSVGVAVQFA